MLENPKAIDLSLFGDLYEIHTAGSFVVVDDYNTSTSNALTYADTDYFVKKAISNPNITALICPPSLAHLIENQEIGLALTEHPRDVFYEIHRRIAKKLSTDTALIHPSAVIHDSAKLGKNVRIGPYSVIGKNVTIGDNTSIEEGVIIGAEGLLWFDTEEKTTPLPHLGSVVIGANSSILANAIIVRAVFAHRNTQIGNHSIIGIGATIGHDAEIGNNVIIAGNSIIARGCKIEDLAHVGPAAFVRERLNIGSKTNIRAGSIVIESLEKNSDVSGNFAIPHLSNLYRRAASLKSNNKTSQK